MGELNELYQQLILDHNKSPRNYRKVEKANRRAEGYNPLCGDHYTVYLEMEEDVIKDAGFQGSGCAISKASASLMTSAVKGKTREEAEELFRKVHRLVTRDIGEAADEEELGSLAALAGVSEFPARIKCASLAWHTMHSALSSDGGVVSTEEGT